MFTLTIYTATHGFVPPITFPTKAAAIEQLKLSLPGCWNTDGNEIAWRDDAAQFGYVFSTDTRAV
jgi:hypothetical protein